VKVKLFEVYNSVPVMNKVLETSVSASLAYHLTKLLKTLNEEMKTIGEKNDKEESLVVSEENKAKFMSEFSDLLNSEIELSWEQLSVEKMEGLQLTVNDMSRIQFLFKD